MDLSKYTGWNDIPNINLCPRDIGYNFLMAAVDEKTTAVQYNNLYHYPQKRLTGIPRAQANIKVIETYINSLIPCFVNQFTVTSNPADFPNWAMWTKESIYSYINEECIDPLLNDKTLTLKGYPVQWFEQRKKILNLLIWTKASYTEDVLYNTLNSWGGGSTWEHTSSVGDAYSDAVSRIGDGGTVYGGQGIYAVARAYHGQDYQENDTYQAWVHGTTLIGFPYLYPFRLMPPVSEPYQQTKYSIDFYYLFELPLHIWGVGIEDATFDGGGVYTEGWNLIDSIAPADCFNAELYKWKIDTRDSMPGCPETPPLNEYKQNGFKALQGGFVKKFDVLGGFKFRAEE